MSIKQAMAEKKTQVIMAIGACALIACVSLVGASGALAYGDDDAPISDEELFNNPANVEEIKVFEGDDAEAIEYGIETELSE